MDRRKFIQFSAGLPAVTSLSSLNSLALPPSAPPLPLDEAQPSEAQRRWMDLKLGMMIHFGLNTYYDAEWSDGTNDPVRYNPVQLDPEQWCRCAKAAGMRYIVFVTKHHDGFCNWPTKATTYSVKASPYKKDVLRKVVDAAHKYDLKVGLYYSLWDRHEKSHDQNEVAYVDFMKRQLEELLTAYGPIVELWFDGFWKKQQSGWTKREQINGEKVSAELRDEAFIQAWRAEGAFRWQMDHLYQFIKGFQPDCMVANNSTTAYPGLPLHPVDIRPGEKATKVRQDRKVWTWLGKDVFLPMQIETTLSVKGNSLFPSGNWFWHEWDHSVASVDQIRQYQQVAQQMEANLLLNVGPSSQGKLRPEDERLLLELAH